MGRIIALLTVILLITTFFSFDQNTSVWAQKDKGKILWDTSHQSIMTADVDILRKNGFLVDIDMENEISYELLNDYDVVVIWLPIIPLHETEINAIKKFVNEGGGLLLNACWAIESSTINAGGATYHLIANKQGFDSLGMVFGIEFDEKGEFIWWFQEINHPILKGVDMKNFENDYNILKWKIGGDGTLKITNNNIKPLLIENDIKNPNIVAATLEYRKGRCVFSSDNLFDEQILKNTPKMIFNLNMFSWLSAPGGPYKQIKKPLEKANAYYESAVNLFDTSDFSNAKTAFSQAKIFFEQSNSVFENEEAKVKIIQVDEYSVKCDKGITATTLFEEGKKLFEVKDFSKAKAKLEEAKALFSEINSGKVQEAQIMISRCDDEIARTQTETPTTLPPQKATGIGFLPILISLLALFNKKKDSS